MTQQKPSLRNPDTRPSHPQFPEHHHNCNLNVFSEAEAGWGELWCNCNVATGNSAAYERGQRDATR